MQRMRPRLYLFGDSITEGSYKDGGWGSALANHFSRRVDVMLRGYSGYNTRWALEVAEKVFPKPETGSDAVAVTVFFGANDACLPNKSSAHQHVPIDEYRKNLRSIVAFLKKLWPSAHVILITPPPIDEAARLRHPFVENPSGLPERTNEAAGDYAKACLTVAAECGTGAVDLWTKMQQNPDWRKAYLVDGLHLTEDGNKVVFEEVVIRLKELGVSLESMPPDNPLETEIHPEDPLKSFRN